MWFGQAIKLIQPSLAVSSTLRNCFHTSGISNGFKLNASHVFCNARKIVDHRIVFSDLRNSCVRQMSSRPSEEERMRSMVYYIASAGIFMLGASYLGVPLYRLFCTVILYKFHLLYFTL